MAWAANVTRSYKNPGRAADDPSDDGGAPELMVQRLNETFAHVTGREPPQQAIHSASAPRLENR